MHNLAFGSISDKLLRILSSFAAFALQKIVLSGAYVSFHMQSSALDVIEAKSKYSDI